MSTTIDIYPTKPHLPLVEQACARTQEMFQELLHRHGIGVTLTVETVMLHDGKPMGPVHPNLPWFVGLELGFNYYIDGHFDSASWPSCVAREDDLFEEHDVAVVGEEWVGRPSVAFELHTRTDDATLRRIEAVNHYFSEYRNAAGPQCHRLGTGWWLPH